jgi:hypothetical protein
MDIYVTLEAELAKGILIRGHLRTFDARPRRAIYWLRQDGYPQKSEVGGF